MKIGDSFKIQVTKEDIELGKPFSATRCAISKALIRKNYIGVRTGPTFAIFTNLCGDEVECIHNGESFVINFDKSKSFVKPTEITFTIV